MAVKQYKPITPSRRWMTTANFTEITKTEPERSLILPLRKKGGRNVHGRITARHRGGGHKRYIRIIDFKRDKINISAQVLAIEYDPNRSARLALLQYTDKEKRYIICPINLKVGDEVMASPEAEIKVANALPLKNIPMGTFIHNLEIQKGRGASLVRSAGASAQILAKEGNYAHIKLPSGEIRLIHLDCWATIGQVANIEHESVVLGKAGRARWLGRRPIVRGVAMNPVDHPHGGGEGKAGQGNPHPVSKWGMPNKGYKTRKKKKYSDKYIVRKRS